MRNVLPSQVEMALQPVGVDRVSLHLGAIGTVALWHCFFQKYKVLGFNLPKYHPKVWREFARLDKSIIDDVSHTFALQLQERLGIDRDASRILSQASLGHVFAGHGDLGKMDVGTVMEDALRAESIEPPLPSEFHLTIREQIALEDLFDGLRCHRRAFAKHLDLPSRYFSILFSSDEEITLPFHTYTKLVCTLAYLLEADTRRAKWCSKAWLHAKVQELERGIQRTVPGFTLHTATESFKMPRAESLVRALPFREFF